MPSASSAIKWILPSGLVAWVRARKRPSAMLWQGIYPSFSDVPCAGRGYESDEWLAPRTEATVALKGELESGRLRSTAMASRYLLLPTCVSAMFPTQQSISVLDFGGAMGIAYVHMASALGELASRCSFHVVDNERSCVGGRDVFAGDEKIHFHTSIADVPSADVVFMSGALQYVDDYAAVLSDIVSRFSPRLFVLTLLPVGDFPTFASAQVNLTGSTLPAWFFNRAELQRLFQALGFTLALQTHAELDFDMSNFPPSHRMSSMSNLVFYRSTDHRSTASGTHEERPASHDLESTGASASNSY